MRLLPFGDDKEDSPHNKRKENEVKESKEKNVDVVYVDDIENGERDNTEGTNEDDDYIDPDDLDCNEYDDVIDNIKYDGWSNISSAGVNPITHFDVNIVVTSPVKKDGYGTALELICAKDMIIAVCGFNQCGIDEEIFYNTPNLYTRPHFITLRLVDESNTEISPKTIISILKLDKDKKSKKLYQEFYGDLSPTRNGELKEKQERYYIAETVILQRGEKLMFHVYQPDRDVSKVELLMMSDIFIKDEE